MGNEELTSVLSQAGVTLPRLFYSIPNVVPGSLHILLGVMAYVIDNLILCIMFYHPMKDNKLVDFSVSQDDLKTEMKIMEDVSTTERETLIREVNDADYYNQWIDDFCSYKIRYEKAELREKTQSQPTQNGTKRQCVKAETKQQVVDEMFKTLRQSTICNRLTDMVRVPNWDLFKTYQNQRNDEKYRQARTKLGKLNRLYDNRRSKLMVLLRKRILQSGVCGIFNKIFAKYQISRETYNARTFNGHACESICKKANLIFSDILEEVKTFKYYRANKEYSQAEITAIKENLETAIEDSKTVIGDISICYSMMTYYDPPSAEDEQLLEKVIPSLKGLWRKLDISVTTKAHYIVLHLLDHIKKFGAMGYNNEQIIERAHSQTNKLANIFRSVKNERQMYLLMQERSWFDNSASIQNQKTKLAKARKQTNGTRSKEHDSISKTARQNYK